jgi:hypothetical protein
MKLGVPELHRPCEDWFLILSEMGRPWRSDLAGFFYLKRKTMNE